MAASNDEKKKLRILCIHGYRQNGSIFKERMGSFRKILKKFTEFVYITAPNVVPPMEGDERKDEDQRGWWFSRKDDSFTASEHSTVDKGFDLSLEVTLKAFAELGPFDGVLGFSQGASFVSMLCTLRDEPDSPVKFDFAVLVAGFRSLSSSHDIYYSKPVLCPSLHVFGDTDRVIPRESSEELLKYFSEPQVLRHEGGHFIPASPPQKKIYLDYFNQWLAKKE